VVFRQGREAEEVRAGGELGAVEDDA